jgi:hypothetical protein
MASGRLRLHAAVEMLPTVAPTTRKRTRSALYALAAETHCQASIPLTKWSLWHQAMADDNFGGMTPKGNVAWVPTALSALATMELA